MRERQLRRRMDVKKHIDYDSIAPTYASHRKPVLMALREFEQRVGLSDRSKVLEVGCGTGVHISSLVNATKCLGIGIDPSPRMLRHSASPRGLELCVGSAEKLPLNEGFFDLVFSLDVIHHLKDTQAYFREAFRVLRPHGAICTVTDSEEIIKSRNPFTVYWPSTVQVDLARYPPIPLLREQMTSVGFAEIEESQIEMPYKIVDSTPYGKKAFSCLQLISEKEFQEGLRRLEQDLRMGPVAGLMRYVCVWGRKRQA